MYQKLILAGNLGNDPELRYLPDGKPVCSFSLAVNEAFKSKAGETVKNTAWFRVAVFGNQAEPCAKYLTKGKQALVEARLAFDPATGGPKIFTRKDGTPGASFELIANRVHFLGASGGAKPEGDDTAAAESQMGDSDTSW